MTSTYSVFGSGRAVHRRLFLMPLVMIGVALLGPQVVLGQRDTISFNTHIRPILADRCFTCHGPDSQSRQANLRLDQEASAKSTETDSGVAAIVAGKPEQSELLRRLTTHDPDERMPPPESKVSVSAAEIRLLREWISKGAGWEKHWAFISPRQTPVPSVKQHSWPQTVVDPSSWLS